MSKIIALDIGGVVISISPGECLKNLGYPAGSEIPRSIYENMILLETGQISEKESIAAVHEATDGKYSDDKIISAFNSILGEPVEGMLDIMRKMTESGFRLVFFSNTSKIHMTHIYKHYEICTLVSGAVLSYEVGAMKPEKKIYDAFEEQFGKPFLYLDDREENIRAGLEMGWNSILFKDKYSLKGGNFKIASMS